MLFKLHSYNNDSSAGHSVYQFILDDSTAKTAPQDQVGYKGSCYDETYGINAKGIQLLTRKLSQIKLEAFTIKQLLN